MAFLLPLAIAAGAGATAYGAHKQAQHGKAQISENKKFQKQEQHKEKKNVKKQKKYNKKHYAGRFGEKAYNKKVSEFNKKYGGEKFQKWDALSPDQKATFKQLNKQGAKGLKNLRTPEDFQKLSKNKLFSGSENTLRDLMKHPGISDINESPYYNQGGSRLQDLLNNPSISDLRDLPEYQAGSRSLQDLLSNDPEAFKRFAAPELRRFNEQTIPDIVGRFGAGGQNNSALNSALANSGADLNERLGALRAGLQSEGRNQALQYGQGLQQGQSAQANIFGSAAGQGLQYADAPRYAQQARADIRGQAARSAPQFSDQYLKQQQLQANNIYNQNQQAGTLAAAGLAVNPYHINYRAPTFQPGIVTGGPKPALYGAGQAPQNYPYQPNAAASFGSNFFQPALQAGGQYAGQKAAENLFSNNSPATPVAQNQPFMKNYNPALPHT